MATLQISIGTRKQFGKGNGHGTNGHVIRHCTPMQSVFTRPHSISTHAMTTISAQMNKEELKATFLPIILIISKTPRATDSIAHSTLSPDTRAGVSEDRERKTYLQPRDQLRKTLILRTTGSHLDSPIPSWLPAGRSIGRRL